MKKIIFLLTIVLLTNIVNAQCDLTPPNTTPITGATLSNGSSTGDNWFKGKMTINTSYNFNNWSHLWFTDSVNVHQSLNFSPNGTITSIGFNSFNYINFTGDSHMEVSGTANIFSMVSNNSNPFAYNTITLYDNALLFYNGIQYFVGDTIQLSGNTTNRVYVLGCDNAPLEKHILFYEMGLGKIDWIIDPIGFSQVKVMYSSIKPTNNDNPNYYIWSVEYVSYNRIDTFRPKKVGMYRIKVENEYSFMGYFDEYQIQFNNSKESPKYKVIYYYNGYFSDKPFPNATYIGTKTIR